MNKYHYFTKIHDIDKESCPTVYIYKRPADSIGAGKETFVCRINGGGCTVKEAHEKVHLAIEEAKYIVQACNEFNIGNIS